MNTHPLGTPALLEHLGGPSVVECYDTRAAWEAGRRAGVHRIGSSMVGRLLLNPWLAVAELRGEAPEPDEATRKRWALGHAYEPAIIAHYEIETGRPAMVIGAAIGRPQATVIMRHPQIPWVVASPDGVTIDPDLGVGFVEAKNYVGGYWADESTEIRTAADYDPALLSPEIANQCYWQMAACPVARFVDVTRRQPYGDLLVIRVHRDDAFIADRIRCAKDARERYLIRGELPPPDASDSCADYYRERHRGQDEGARPATDDDALLINAMAAGRAQEKAGKAAAEEARNALMAAMGPHTRLYIPGGRSVNRNKAGAISIRG